MSNGDGCDSTCIPEFVAVDSSESWDSIGTDTAHNIGVDGANRILVVTRRRTAGGESLVARRIGPYGAFLSTPTVVDPNLGSLPTSADPTVAGLPDGGWVVVWTAIRDGSLDIVFRLVNADGSLGASEVVANRFRIGTQWDPEVVATDSGFVIGWTDAYGGVDDPRGGVVARVFSKTGTGLSQDIRLATDRGGAEGQLSLAAIGDRWFAAWETSSETTSFLPDIRMRGFQDATPLASAESSLPYGPADLPDVSPMPATDTFAVVARSFAADGHGDFYFAQHEPSGRLLAGFPASTDPSDELVAFSSSVHAGALSVLGDRGRTFGTSFESLGMIHQTSALLLGDVLVESAVGGLNVVADANGYWVGFDRDVADSLRDEFTVIHIGTDGIVNPCTDPTRCGRDRAAGTCWNTWGYPTCICAAGHEQVFEDDVVTCVDIDECLVENGGCSTAPFVACVNTSGSRTCGACPLGYVGDGVVCEYVDCGVLAPPANGTVATSPSTSAGSSASYGCNPGYSRNGSATRQCTEQGSWSGSAPTCQVVESLCPAPSSVVHAGAPVVSGGVAGGSTRSLGATAAIACNVGYAKDGVDATCQSNGTWTAAPSCRVDEVWCPTAPIVSNAGVATLTGGLVAGTRSLNATAAYLCNAGYSKSGSDAVCQSNKTWTTAPTCTPTVSYCVGAPVVSNASAAVVSGGIAGGASTSLNATAAYSCNPGYAKSGTNPTCQVGGTWSTPPSCSPIATYCPAPATVSNASAPSVSGGIAGGTTRSLNAVASYTCNTGYTKNGANPTCQSGGAWSAAPTCTPTTNHCPAAPTVTNSGAPVVSGGLAGGTTTSLNATASYTCNAGYVKTGSNATCQSSGTWSTAPTCAYDCGAPSSPTNGSVSTSPNTLFGATATYTCNPGYTLTGTSPRSCSGSGWSGSAPTCVIKNCGALAAPLFGTVSTPSGTTYGATATYSCSHGFATTGNASRQCDQNGAWTGVPAMCVVQGFAGDFDADGRRDDHAVATWATVSPLYYTWKARRTNDTDIFTGLVFGTYGDVPLVGDFDSDGVVDDVGTYRPSTSTWRFRRTDGSIIYSVGVDGVAFGQLGDLPVIGDFDSDGYLDDMAVYRPSTRTWYAKHIDDLGWCFTSSGVQLGASGYENIPMVGDIDSDGQVDDLVVYRRTIGSTTALSYWYAKKTDGTTISVLNGLQHGLSGDIPHIGDFDGDNRFDDIDLTRRTTTTPNSGDWRHYMLRPGGTAIATNLALGGWWFGQMVVGDFDGDNRLDDVGYFYGGVNNVWSAFRVNGTVIMSDVP